MVPGLLPICRMLSCCQSGTLAATAGDSSVQPYPSSGMTWNFSLNSLARDCGSFSAPHIRMRTLRKLSGSQRLR